MAGDTPAAPTPGAKPEATAPAATAPPNPSVEPWPDATPVPVEPARAPADTIPEPGTKPAGAADAGAAEDPTRMPGPREIPPGNPDEPAPPPGFVPPGDSRSLRRRTDAHEFALIYRVQTHVIVRFGKVGTRGQWRVVEYPTSASASHAYAKECSRFVSDGFSDYRA